MTESSLEMKTCSRCRIAKIRAVHFSPQAIYCQECVKLKAREWRARNHGPTEMRQDGLKRRINELFGVKLCARSPKEKDPLK